MVARTIYVVAGRVWQVVIHCRFILIRDDPGLGKRSFKTGGRS